MSNDWVVTILAIIGTVAAIVLVAVFLTHHPFIAGFLIGLAVGIGGTLTYLSIRNHLRTHEWVEKPPPK
jgi:protein-S-isoprenylcysteine O-methyltransferase Ste14